MQDDDKTLIPFLDNMPDTELAPLVDENAGEIEVIHDNQVGFTAGKKTYRMLGTKVNAINGNNRLYPRVEMTDAINHWKEIRKGALGEEPHPESYIMADGKLGWKSITANNVIKVLDIHLPDKDGNVFFDFQTLDTAKGKDLQAVLDAGGQPGCSMRAGGRAKMAMYGDRKVAVATFLDLFTFDIVPNPALPATLGSVVPLTDSQVDELLQNKKEDTTKPYSDAVDPLIEQVKSSNGLPDLERISVNVEQMELDAVDRAAFESAYYRRYWQIRKLIEIQEMEKSGRRIGYLDNQNEGDEVEVKYTFEQLSAMTDAELQQARKEAPECVAMIDAIITQRASAAELQSLKDAQVKREAADAAKTFMDSQEVKDKLAKLPAHVQETVRARVDLSNKESAEKSFTDAYEFATSLVAEDKLKAMGFNRSNSFTDTQASTNIEVTGEDQSWKEFTDKLNEAVEDNYRMFNGVKDANLIKMNKPILDMIMKRFDKANAAALSRFADDINSASSTVSLLNGVAFHRQIIEQAFQTMCCLQFVQIDTFSGEFLEIPRETYNRSNSRPLNNGEMQAMAKGKLSLDFLHVAAESRKLAAEVTLEALRRLETGPLNYDILGRLAYHLSQDLQRDQSLRLHNEMLYASDEYGAERVTNETPNINGDRTEVTLLRGGTSGAPNLYVPVVRPRTTFYWTNGGKQSVKENEIIVRVDGAPVDLTGAVIDFENGKIRPVAALPAGAVTVDYSYATNVALFNLTVPDGVEVEKYYNQLIHLIGAQKALMGAQPRFYTPNFMLMSETISNEVSQAEQFAELFKRNGTELQPNGYVGRTKAIDAYEHNEPWAAGDTRILLGQRLATKYGVGTGMTTKGPFPTRDGNGELTGGEELYIFMDDATITPIKQQFRTIRLYRS